MKKSLQLVTILLAACAGAHAQVAPAAVAGPASFNYSFNYAQNTEFGSGIGNWQTIIASGMVAYRNGFERLPFSLNYSGGYTFTVAGPPISTGYYQHLLASQGFRWRKWDLNVSDNVSYLPQAPISGFPGIPGTGQPGGGTNPPSDQSILTLKTRAVDNFVNVGLTDQMTSSTSMNASGGWGVQRYPDGNGINGNTTVASLGVNQRLNVRMSLSGSYAYSQFSYPDYGLSFTSNTAFFGFTRNWSRKISSGISGGPQWVSSSDSALIPSSTNFAINGDIRYHLRSLSAGLIYTRGVSGGAGYLLGAESDIVTASVAREFGRKTNIGVDGSYRRIAGLNNNGVVSSEDVGVQATRRLGQHFSAFVGYTAIYQGSSAALPTNVLTNLLQTLSFGFSYSPRHERINR